MEAVDSDQIRVTEGGGKEGVDVLPRDAYTYIEGSSGQQCIGKER